jgi:hypothetical protein
VASENYDPETEEVPELEENPEFWLEQFQDYAKNNSSAMGYTILRLRAWLNSWEAYREAEDNLTKGKKFDRVEKYKDNIRDAEYERWKWAEIALNGENAEFGSREEYDDEVLWNEFAALLEDKEIGSFSEYMKRIKNTGEFTEQLGTIEDDLGLPTLAYLFSLQMYNENKEFETVLNDWIAEYHKQNS